MPILSGAFWQKLWRRTKSVRHRNETTRKPLRVRLEELESRLAPASAQFPNAWTAAAPLNAARSFDTATLLNDGTVLVAGGNGGASGALNSAELYNPSTNSWSFTANNMAVARSYASAVLLADGRVLVAGGGNSTDLSSAEIYDPSSKTWSTAASMNTPRRDFTLTLLPSGKVLAAGGHSGFTVQARAEVYDPAVNTWSPVGSMLVAHQTQTATLLGNGKVLIAGGDTTNTVPTNETELYDPNTGTWSAAALMVNARHRHTATLLPGGKVLVTAGTNTANAEIYDPSANTWTSAGSVDAPRGWFGATVLSNGEVLIAGGWNPTNGELSSTDIYDPISNSWWAGSPLATARDGHTVTALPSGQVLVAGGETAVNSSYVTLSSSELFQQQAGFVISAPLSTTAGGTFSFTVTAEDASGNTLTGDTGTVHFTSNDPQAILPGDYTFNAGDAGVHTFVATLKTSGSKSLSASDSVNFLFGQSSILVNAAAAVRFALSGPSSVSANSTFSITVTACDAYGNVATGYRGTVHFSDSLSGATLPVDYALTAADSGVHTFSGLKLKSRGTQTIKVVDTMVGSIIGTWVINVT
jgi:hypothetical protein